MALSKQCLYLYDNVKYGITLFRDEDITYRWALPVSFQQDRKIPCRYADNGRYKEKQSAKIRKTHNPNNVTWWTIIRSSAQCREMFSIRHYQSSRIYKILSNKTNGNVRYSTRLTINDKYEISQNYSRPCFR